jgi:multicomponent Na+:H+ antiporter subunit E
MADTGFERNRVRLTGVIRRTLWFVLLWLILTDGSLEEPVVALLVIGLATASSFRVWSSTRRQVLYLEALRFIPYFIRQSVGGGWDVARRALHPRLPLAPGLTLFPLRLKHDTGRIFLTLVISLFPGTASVKLEGNMLCVHVLDRHMAIPERLRDLEERVARVYGEKPGPSEV